MLRTSIVALLGLAWCVPAWGGGIIQPQPKSGDPLPDLTAEELNRFLLGAEAFGRSLTAEEGLGPVFNKESCGNCHTNPFGGAGNQTVTRFGTDDKEGFNPLEEFGGSLLQAQTIDLACEEVIPDEATITTLRVTNGSLGYGLIEAIPDADIQALADNPPPGISGRAHIVPILESPGETAVGRFGWKAQLATMLSFSADAAQNEMGLSNRIIPFDNDPNGVRPPELIDCDNVADPEDFTDEEGFDFIDRVTDFTRFLGAPPQTPKFGMSGEVIFNDIGCADCHTPSFTTADSPLLEDALRNKVIRPYSDFLLHDMGQAADFIAQGEATERELRTPVLWGVRTRDPFWHDGRFGAGTFESRITLAIMEHDSFLSEGQASAQNFDALTQESKDAVIAFLNSLGRIEFDADGDDDVELDDFVAFHGCFDTVGVITPDDDCAVSDIDQDLDVDLNDYDSFLVAYTGTRGDCNCNGILDISEILDGSEEDVDDDGIPDSCATACVEDLDCNGGADVLDLLLMLSNWGPCSGGPEPCAADFDADQIVGAPDLLQLLGLWAPCP